MAYLSYTLAHASSGMSGLFRSLLRSSDIYVCAAVGETRSFVRRNATYIYMGILVNNISQFLSAYLYHYDYMGVYPS